MRNLITTADFTVDELNSLMETARDISKNPEKYADKCRGKKLATVKEKICGSYGSRIFFVLLWVYD